MKKLMFTLALTTAVVAGAFADEDPIAAAMAKVAEVDQQAKNLPQAVVDQIVATETEKNPPPTAKEMKNDAGVQTVIKMQDDGKFPEQDAREKTATDQVLAVLKKNGIKVERTKDRYVHVEETSIPTNVDPAKDDAFMLKRDMMAKQLVMRMKQRIAEGLGGILDADERVETFGSTNELTSVKAGIKVPTKPIFGVTLLAQAESWDGKNYKMAAAAVWSKALEKSARATLLGVPAKGKGGEKSLSKWLADNDLSLMCGPRQLVGPDGERIFVGIAARETGINAVRDRANKRAAQISALSYTMLSLYADVDMVTGQNAAMEVFEKEDKTADVKAWEELTDRVAQSAHNRVVEGANEVYSTTVEHPISGKKMIVSVYSIDANSVAAARVRIEEMFALRYITELANKRALGRHRGYQDKVDEAKANTEEYNKGRAEGRAAVQKKVAPPKSRSVSPVATPAEAPAAKSQSGTFSGESTISNDF